MDPAELVALFVSFTWRGNEQSYHGRMVDKGRDGQDGMDLAVLRTVHTGLLSGSSCRHFSGDTSPLLLSDSLYDTNVVTPRDTLNAPSLRKKPLAGNGTSCIRPEGETSTDR